MKGRKRARVTVGYCGLKIEFRIQPPEGRVNTSRQGLIRGKELQYQSRDQYVCVGFWNKGSIRIRLSSPFLTICLLFVARWLHAFTTSLPFFEVAGDAGHRIACL